MTPLNRALAFSQADHVAVFVGQYLELDVARVLDIFLQVEIAVAESGRRLRLRLAVKRGQFIFIAHNTHAASAAARRGFQNDRKLHLPRPLARLFRRRNHAIRPGKNRHAVLLHGGAGFFFFAHQPDHIRSRPDELNMTGFADFGEVGIFR